MDLRNINDENLLALVEKNRTLELNTLTQSLHYLIEVDARRLFSKYGYESLHKFLTKHLRQSEDEAGRRIAAARLLKELPQIEERINSGAFSLTTLTQAQALFRREAKQDRKLTRAKKLELMDRIEGKSKRETERIIASASPEVHIPDKIKAISQSQIMLQFAAADSLEGKIEELRGILAHTHPGISLGELNHWLCDFALAALKGPAPARVRKAPNAGKPMSKAAVRREVWKRDRHECTKCKSKFALQVDHIIPKALGGRFTLENLRLLCRNCNLRAAVEVFGRDKMEKSMRRRDGNDGS